MIFTSFLLKLSITATVYAQFEQLSTRFEKKITQNEQYFIANIFGACIITYEVIKLTVGQTIIYLRERDGISRKDLAAALDMPYTTLRNYEEDAREPGHRVLIALSKYFHVSVDYLLGLKSDKKMAIADMDDSRLKKVNTIIESLEKMPDEQLDAMITVLFPKAYPDK